MSLVLDSSMTLSWYFEDEQTDATRDILKWVADRGGMAPSLWRYEVANAFHIAVRRGRVDTHFRDASLDDLASLSITIDQESDGLVWSASLKLAERHALTIYDAAYLELAQRRRLSLASLDRALCKAAASEGVATLGV